MLASLNDVATYDEEGCVEGFQFDSRARRIQEWREKKEEQDFARLVAKLRQKKRWRAWYDRHKDAPEFKEKMRQHNKRMKDRHRDRRNAEWRERYRNEIARKEASRNVCCECGKEFFQEAGFKKKRFSKFCSQKCRNRNSHKRRDRNTSSRKEAVLKAVRSNYSVTVKEATAHVDFCQASVQAMLNCLVKEGKIRKYTDERPYRYSVW